MDHLASLFPFRGCLAFGRLFRLGERVDSEGVAALEAQPRHGSFWMLFGVARLLMSALSR